jgi:hypothetical protein
MNPQEGLQAAIDAGLTQTARMFAQIINANNDRDKAKKLLADLVQSIITKDDQLTAFNAAVKYMESK